MSNEERLYYLLNKVLADKATAEELQELAVAVKDDVSGATSLQVEAFLNKSTADTTQLSGEKMDTLFNNILAADKNAAVINLPSERTPVFHINRRIAVAVAVLLLFGTGFFWWMYQKSNTKTSKDQLVQQNTPDIHPGGNKAKLTLVDGSVIILDSVANGSLAHQGNTNVQKLNDNQLLYIQDHTDSSEISMAYNILSTPRGGQYQMTLSDGTKVWLNAASSLRFPAFFTGNERVVELTGEAYFEVAKNTSKPFKVTANNMQVEVLGTHFNIMAYEEEKVVKTTLLEGIVKVTAPAGNRLLKPGQQASLDLVTHTLEAPKEADIEEAVAWKNGYFQFNKIDSSSLRQLARWYNIDVVYKGGIRENEFKGKINRSIKLSSIVEALQISGIHCSIDKSSLIILP